MPQSPKYLWDFFIGLGFPSMVDPRLTWVFIENVHAMPNDAKGAIWSFAKHIGQLEMLSELLSMHPTYITPQSWQKWLSEHPRGLKRQEEYTKPQWKSALAKRAKEDTCNTGQKSWEKYITLATADAYWIALYGWEKIASGQEENTDGSEKIDHKIPIR